MKYFFFVFSSALKDFTRNRVRTLLTSLGILIGVLSVVLLVAIGVGLQDFINQQFEDLGSNTLIIQPGEVLDEEGGFSGGAGPIGADTPVRFDEEDYIRLQRIREIEYVGAAFALSGNVRYQENEEFTSIFYATETIFPLRNFNAEFGQLYTDEDSDKRSKVVVLGRSISEDLFGNPALGVGKRVTINDQAFRVVGVIEEVGSGGFGGPDFDSFIFIPYKTGFLLTDTRNFTDMLIRPKSEEVTDIAKRKVETELLKKYDDEDFSIVEQTEILEAVTSIFNTVNVALVGIATISLIVGGIGIMNIMYVTVTERTKEIGIRRAIGARKFDILSQFIMESVLLSVFGGILAIILAYIIVYFIRDFFPARINIDTILLALGVSSSIGVIFGVFPAKKASDLSPIEAIRYE